jgi:hypothetical protein
VGSADPLSIACPLRACGAGVGQPCVRRHHRGTGPHATRAYLANRQARRETPGTARHKFSIGQRVRLSEAGRKALLGEGSWPDRRRRMAPTGVVLGFSHSPHLVGVRPDGGQMRRPFHMDFWEPIPNGAVALERTPHPGMNDPDPDYFARADDDQLDTAAQLDLSPDLNNPQEG